MIYRSIEIDRVDWIGVPIQLGTDWIGVLIQLGYRLDWLKIGLLSLLFAVILMPRMMVLLRFELLILAHLWLIFECVVIQSGAFIYF